MTKACVCAIVALLKQRNQNEINTLIFSESTLTGCYAYDTWGIFLWTAGQRVDTTRASTFVWRVTSTNICSETVSSMAYSDWETGEPNAVQTESCVSLSTGRSYKWHDCDCSHATCSVCELDI